MKHLHKSRTVRRKYTFIKAHRRAFDTAMMCRLLDVSRSGFYQWLRNPLSDRAVEDQRLLGLIRASYTASHGVYGAPRIFLDLREAGETCSKHRVARIMRANNLKARYGYRAPRYTRSPTSLLTPNTLQRGFTVPRPNTAWVNGYYLCAHVGRRALSGRRDGPLLPSYCRLVHTIHDGSRACAGRDPHGRTATQAQTHTDSFRSRLTIWQ
jgi:hypothetical protein